MFSMYSKGSEYAIRALAEISAANASGKFLARDICRKAGIPEAYARKTFQALVENGFLKAVPGPGGGYSLARDPEKTTVLDIVQAVEGNKSFSHCVLGFSICGEKKPCALHTMWVHMKKGILEGLGSRTLRELSESVQNLPKKNKRKARR